MSNEQFIKWANEQFLKSRAYDCFAKFQNDVINGKDYFNHELLKLIDKYTIEDEKRRFYRILKSGTKLYRARIVKELDSDTLYEYDIKSNMIHGYNESNSREAPLGISGNGRNNISGVSYLYVSKEVGTACVEVKSSPRDLISLATFETRRNLQYIDFSNDVKFDIKEIEKERVALGLLFTYIMRSYMTPICDDNEKQIYQITQIITDHIRKSGIDGIAYRSYYNRTGINFTFFNSHHNYFEFMGSRILVNQSQRTTFLDYEKERSINIYSENDTKFDKKIADQNMRDIVNSVKRS